MGATAIAPVKKNPIEALAAGGTESMDIAMAISKLADVAAQFKNSGCSQRLLVLILHDSSGVAKRDITAILEALPKLRSMYLTK